MSSIRKACSMRHPSLSTELPKGMIFPYGDRALPGRLAEDYQALLALCDRLEQVADDLPGRVDRQDCLILSRAIGPMLNRIQHFEETEIFPVLLEWPALHGELLETIERLKLEHQVDACYAEDVQDMLHGLGEGRPHISSDAAGFMLRGFFESLRRHVAHELQLIVPLIELVLRRNPSAA
jgi:hemerythrin-like domain-containing protein